MKVLYIAASLSHEWGGPVPVIKALSECLLRKGVEVDVFAPAKRRTANQIAQLDGVSTTLFKLGFFSRIWTAHSPALAQALRREISEIDLVHIHEIWHHPHFAAYRAAKKARKPYIVSIQGALEPWCLSYKALKKKVYAALIQKRILNEAATIHAVNQEEVKHIRAFGVKTPVTVISNGIDPEEFQNLPPREEMERLYPELKGRKVLLFVGRIHPIKGLDILARAFGQIATCRDDVRLVIVGPDSEGYQNQVERLLKSESVLDKTIFTGMLAQKKKLAALSRADIFVLSSYSEGFSIAVLEALACGLPMIITSKCHFPEVAEARAGIVINPDSDQLAEALAKLLGNPELSKGMSANGRRLVMEKFSWDRIADQMIQVYQDVLGGKMNIDHNLRRD